MHAAIVTGVSRGLGEALAAAMLARGFTVLGVGRDGERRASTGKRYPLRRVRSRAAGAARRRRHAGAARASPRRKPTSVTPRQQCGGRDADRRCVGTLDAARDRRGARDERGGAGRAWRTSSCRSFPDDAVERRIINISSGAAQTAIAGSAVYCMSKAALEMLTRAIAAECSAPRFRCISLRPGIFETGMQAYMRSRDPARVSERRAVPRLQGERAAQGSRRRRGAGSSTGWCSAPIENGRTYSHTDF